MKHLTFSYADKNALKKAKSEAKKSSYSSQLIQIFTALTDEKEIKKLLHDISKKFPNALVIGTTTAGEISHAKIYDNSTIISLSLFKKTKLITHKIDKIDKKSGELLSKAICSKTTKAAIVLSEGLKGLDYEGFIKGIKKENPQLIIAGGLAGDNFLLKETFVFLGTKIYKEGAVAVSFSGKSIFADNRYNLNWTPIGKEFTITSADSNIVKTIDNENAVTIFKRYLGSEIFENSAVALPDIQLLYKEGNTIVSRTPMAIDGDTLIFAGPLKEGQKVQFGFSNAASVISGSNAISKKISKNPAEAIFIYSCIARKTLLGKTLEYEFEPFESIAPTAGFFTYGEFYSTTGDNALLNCTTTILILSEGKKEKTSQLKSNSINTKNLENITFNALTHFIKQTSIELHDNTLLLKEYKNVVDESSLVSKADKEGTITYVNDNFCKISQYSRDELVGQNHNIIRDPSVSSFIFKKMWSKILSGKIWKGMLSNKAKDGSIYFVDATIMPILDNNHQIKEFIAIRQDISKQIESKKRIQEKEKLIKAIFDNQDSIVLFSSKTEGMLNANKKLFHYLDFKNFEDFKSQHDCICNLFIKEDGYLYPSKYPNWIDDIANDKTDEDRKAKILTKDGVIRTFNVIVKKIDDAYIINLYDITNLEEAILKANASEQAKSIFLANMSHEIRTPLNGILGFTDILMKKELQKDEKRYIDIIHKSGQTLLNVVNDILDYSKLESGELSLYETDANLFKEMEAGVATFASLSKNKHIDYYTYIDTNIPKALHCDTQRIKQVINNLISNAIKFTPDGGAVKVNILLKNIAENKATITFSIEDSGIGIAADKIDTIFQAFSQADNSTSREFGGTGLGLSISNQYINMMGSKIEVRSKLNTGSRFYFDITLPILNYNKSIKDITGIKKINLAILSSENEISCAINDIVYTYLKAWGFHYTEIYDIRDIDASVDIIIICAKLFKEDACINVLNKFDTLQLIYIEGAEDNFKCSHDKFHLIEQPMTGSLLFDNLIDLTNSNTNISTHNANIESKSIIFRGNILIAEDNETNQMLISIMLDERNLRYTIVNNGSEAVNEATLNNYDLIFMDINMPIMDGLTATKLLRKSNYIKPIVSLSANVIESDRKLFLEAGVDYTLNKPIMPQELDNVLKKYLTKGNKQNDIMDYDTIDVNIIGKNLGINNPDIILRLLQSFDNTLRELQVKMQTNGLDKDLIHNLKGVTSNLRFKKIYELLVRFEESIDNWNEEISEKNKNTLLSHIQKLLSQIESILK